jgi:hypothetical protein
MRGAIPSPPPTPPPPPKVLMAWRLIMYYGQLYDFTFHLVLISAASNIQGGAKVPLKKWYKLKGQLIWMKLVSIPHKYAT